VRYDPEDHSNLELGEKIGSAGAAEQRLADASAGDIAAGVQATGHSRRQPGKPNPRGHDRLGELAGGYLTKPDDGAVARRRRVIRGCYLAVVKLP
jgi:hypothetical protein